MKIGFFGGCFNPPTNIHINIANNLIKEGKLDKVVFVPVNDFYKKQNLALAKHRVNMLKLAIGNQSQLEVNDIEIKENSQLFAVDIFRIIDSSYEDKNNIFFIMGSDNYDKMPTWKEYEKIKNKYNFIVIERDEKDVSSTKIRDMIKKGNDKVIDYLPKEVYNYIKKNELYKL